MVICTRCCLNYSIRVMNAVVVCCGMVMIVYSLWLLKRWKAEIADMVVVSVPPTPWFIYACLGQGILVCMTMVFGHIVANHLSVTTLSIYVVSICSILLFQGGLFVVILFKMDWKAELSQYFVDKDTKVQNFLIFNLIICRWIGIAIFLAQASILWIAVLLLVARPVESRSHCPEPNMPELRHSFLDRSNLPLNLSPSTSISSSL